MIKKIAALLTVAAVAGALVTLAQAGTAKSHKVHQTGEGSGIGHPPFAGSGSVCNGTWAGTLGTTGAIIERRVLQNPDPDTCAATSLSGTVMVFGPEGSYSGKITAATITQSNAAAPPSSVDMTVKVTAGSGLYKGVTGTITIRHTYIAGSPGFYSVLAKGTLKY